MLSPRRVLAVLAATAVLAVPGCTSSSTSGHPATPSVPSVSASPGGPDTQLPKDFPLPSGGRLTSAKENPNGGVMLSYSGLDKNVVTSYLAAFAKAGWQRTTVNSGASGALYQLTRTSAQVFVGYTNASRLLTVSYTGP